MPANEAELKELMRAGLDGDAAAYRLLLEQLSARLRAYFKGRLARMGRCAAEAEDLVQEALMGMHTRRHTYDRDEPLTPWVYAIARYKLIDHLRRTQSIQTDVPIEDAEEILANDDHGSAESAHDLQKLLSSLPNKMRRAIECVKLEGLSVAEAARRCGMSESAVKVNVHRGLKALAASMREKRE
ncbi:MAG: sigma-70 family RNA polymerase sigma factor [Hyphomicrobiaceae bacterium]